MIAEGGFDGGAHQRLGGAIRGRLPGRGDSFGGKRVDAWVVHDGLKWV